MKTLSILAITAAITVAAPAIAADTSTEVKATTSQDSSGDTKQTYSKESTDAAGTTSKTNDVAKTNVSSDGSTDTTVTKEHSTDPKGLGNKTSAKTTDKTKRDANGKVVKKHKKVVNGTTTESTTSTEQPASAQ